MVRTNSSHGDLTHLNVLRGTYHRRVEEAINISLKNLGLDYVDLFLVSDFRSPLNNI